MASRVLFEDSVYEPGLEQAANEKAIKSRKGQGEGGVKKIAAAETRYLTISKGIVIGSILLAAGLVSTGTYIFLEREEDDDYINSVSFFSEYENLSTFLQYQTVSDKNVVCLYGLPHAVPSLYRHCQRYH